MDPVLTIPRALTVALAACLLLTACVPAYEQTTKDPRDPDPTAGPTDAPVDPELDGASLEELYGQSVTWGDCGDGFECASVSAPLNWSAPEEGTIAIALQRWPAEGSDRIGSLLINPGGPGSSGIEFLEWAVDGTFSPEIREAFDIVGFDPRGVAGSTAVDCGGPEILDRFFIEDVPMESQADVEAALEIVAEFGGECLDRTGSLLGHVDTISAARDLDLLRAVLGDDELYYAGFSYGTFLGATYAGLYPERVGRLLLDGALDPAMSGDDLLRGQAEGFENALRAYVADCQASTRCPLTGSVDDGLRQVRRVVDTATATPLPAGPGEYLNGTMAWTGVVVTLYDEASWPYLTMGLQEAIQENTGEILLMLANVYYDRENGYYLSNSNEAFTAINCLDYPATPRDFGEMEAFAEELRVIAPTFGDSFAMGVGCEAWPFAATGVRAPISAAGSAPIVVVGTTGDPATPYAWSVELARQLEAGVLVTYEGEGHTAYGRSNDCIQDAVDEYLLTGAAPPDGLVC